jgi:CRP-like cAMP-binding protein
MSEARAASAGDPRAPILSFLATVPLLHGISDADRAELAAMLRERHLRPGEVLWQEGETAAGMVIIIDGRVSLSMNLPGERAIEFPTLGSGEVLGEVPLFDGGQHSATVRAVGPVRLLWLGRNDFSALLLRRHPIAFALKRQIAVAACGRLRVRLATVTASLMAQERVDGPLPTPARLGELDFCRAPDSSYIRRIATFRAVEPLALWGFLTAGRFARCAPGQTLAAEGGPVERCFLTINGAVEKVIVRGGRRIRIGLAGPGQPFGYEGLIEGGHAPLTTTTRERSLLLVLPREAFQRLFGGDGAESTVFLDVILRDLMMALRQVQRPHARLAASPLTGQSRR